MTYTDFLGLVYKVTVQTEFVGFEQHWGERGEYQAHWYVTFRMEGRSFETDFWCGSAHGKTPPLAADVLGSCAMDYSLWHDETDVTDYIDTTKGKTAQNILDHLLRWKRGCDDLASFAGSHLPVLLECTEE